MKIIYNFNTDPFAYLRPNIPPTTTPMVPHKVIPNSTLFIMAPNIIPTPDPKAIPKATSLVLSLLLMLRLKFLI